MCLRVSGTFNSCSSRQLVTSLAPSAPSTHSPQRQDRGKQRKANPVFHGSSFQLVPLRCSPGPSVQLSAAGLLPGHGCVHSWLTHCLPALSSLNLFLPTDDCMFVNLKVPKERFFWVQLVVVFLLHRCHELVRLGGTGHSRSGTPLVSPMTQYQGQCPRAGL